MTFRETITQFYLLYATLECRGHSENNLRDSNKQSPLDPALLVKTSFLQGLRFCPIALLTS
uniref:Uncharacterized protein n=1 Tax=Arion vulgaris TaxID=1028688 RepID=A0A0B6XZY4_9EUPU